MAKKRIDRVLETTLSDGVGDIVLAGAVTGFQSFASKLTVSDTFDYVIYAVDLEGTPTGAWETGVGTYESAGVFSRAVEDSSNGGALTAFAAGTKYVALTEIASSVSEGGGLPVGGTTGQVLTKNSETDGDAGWAEVTGGGGGGSSAYSVPLAFTAPPVASETLLIHAFAEAVDFGDNFVGAVSSIGTNPTTDPFVLDLNKNGTGVGTISTTAAGVVTFNTTGAGVSFAIGDVLTAVAAATPDASLANCAFTLKGTRA